MTDRPGRGAILLVALAASAVFLLSSGTTWRGLGDWDAVFYVDGALNWYEAGAFLGENHWQLRHPLVLPIAASFGLFGPGELAATLPNLAYGLLLVVVSAILGVIFLGTVAGSVLALLVATSGPLVLQPLQIEIRGPELFFSALALWLFLSAMGRDGSAKTLFFAGLAAGVAWLCREVAGYLLPTFVFAGLLFAPAERRWRTALLPAAAFISVLATELLTYTIAAGDPLYRYKIDLGHGRDLPGTEFAGDIGDGKGVFEILTEPLLRHMEDISTVPVILFGALAALIVLVGWRGLAVRSRLVVKVFALGALMSYVLAALALNLELPNYFPMLNYLALVLVATAASIMWRTGTGWIAGPAIAALCFAGPFMVGLGERYEFDNYRHAAALARTEERPLVTSFRVAERASLLLRLDGWSSEAAEAEFVLHSEAELGRLALRPSYPNLGKEFALGPEWIPRITLAQEDRTWPHDLLALLGNIFDLPQALATAIEPSRATLLTREGELP